MNTQILKSVNSKWFVLCALILMSKFCLAFGEVKISGPEGTNTPYNLSNFDITIGKIKMPDIATGSTSGHLLLVKEATNGWVREMPLYTGGTAISVSGSNVVTNTAPDQTVTLTGDAYTVTGGTYPNLTVGRATKTFNNAPNRSIVTTAAAANGFQISSTKDSNVSYSVTINTTVSLSGNSSGYVLLEICPTNSEVAGNWIPISRSTSGQSGTLVIGLTLNQAGGGSITGIVPAGYFARLRSVNTSGTPSYSANEQQEVY